MSPPLALISKNASHVNDNDNDNMFYFLLIYISRKLISICQDIYFPTDQQEKGASEAQLINDAPFFTITISYINRRDIFTFQYLIAYSVFGDSMGMGMYTRSKR